MKNEILCLKNNEILYKDIIKLSFDFEITKFNDEILDDENFNYPDEFFMVNLGELEKFTSDYVYQSKIVLFKDGNSFNFGGYSPDWNRKCQILKDTKGNTKFDPSKKYHVELTFSKYRCYIDINYGEIVSTYGNARLKVSDVKFFVRKGFEVKISNTYFFDMDDIDRTVEPVLKDMIDRKIIDNYLYYHVDDYGVSFDRMNIIQNIKCTTRNSGQYTTNIMLDMYTNSKKVGIEYVVMDTELESYPYKFGLFINRKKIETKENKAYRLETHYDEFIVPDGYKENNRLTIVFPNNNAIAVKRIVVDEGTIYYPVKKDMTIMFLGDSITECSECIDAGTDFTVQIALAFNAKIIDHAISGRTFNDYNVLGEYNIHPDYIINANGTNSFAMGTIERNKAFEILDRDFKQVMKDIELHFPKSKIIGLLPIWRSDEIGPKFTLREISMKLKELYSRYKNVDVIDCYDFIPHGVEYYSSSELLLHPSSKGHLIYGKRLVEELKPIIGNIDKTNDESMADLIISLA